MTTYGTMQDRIADELDRTDLTTQIQRAIKSAIDHYSTAEWWFLEGRTTASLTTSSGAEYYPMPDRLRGVDSVVYNKNGTRYRMVHMPYTVLEDYQGGTASPTGDPQYFATYGTELRLYPIPNAALVVTLSGPRALTSLSATTDSNAWMTDAEELIRSRARADVQINVINDQAAMQAMAVFAMRGEPFLSAQEKSAWLRLYSRNTALTCRGYTHPTDF